MSYLEAKRERHRQLVEGLHGGAGPGQRGLPPIRIEPYGSRPTPPVVMDDDDFNEPGWGPAIEVPASLIFPSLGGES